MVIMENPTDDSQMEILFDRFMNSCFSPNGGDPDIRSDLEIGDLLQLKGIYLEKAKAAILAGLESNRGYRSIYCVKVLNLEEAVPIMQKWLEKNKKRSNVPDGRQSPSTTGVYTLRTHKR
jgi:hypothetical protein